MDEIRQYSVNHNLMTMRSSFFILILISSFTCYGQTYSNLVDDTVINQFMNWKLYNDSFKTSSPKEYFTLSSSILAWSLSAETSDSGYERMLEENLLNGNSKELNKLLSKEDLAFMVNQAKSLNTKKWSIIIKPPKNAKKGYNLYLSFPLFSLDKQYVIFKELYYCGETCGEERTMLYKHTETGWNMFRYLSGGVF